MKNKDVETLSTAKWAVETAQQAIDHLDVFVKEAERKKAAADAIARYKVKIHIE
jgi:hypothetical protein